MIAGSRDELARQGVARQGSGVRAEKRELMGRLRRLIFKDEQGWIEWEKGLVLAYTPGQLNEEGRGVGYERLCLSCGKGSKQGCPEDEDGKRLMLLLGLVLLDEARCFSDLAYEDIGGYEDRVDEKPCLVVEWREWPNRS